MTLEELAAEFFAVRSTAGLVLSEEETLDCAVTAARFYAGYGDIRALSLSDVLPGAPIPGDPLPVQETIILPSSAVNDIRELWQTIASPQAFTVADGPYVVPSLPVKVIDFVGPDTGMTMGEWAVIRPLFILYVERENAVRLEASRGMGVDVYGRTVSEVAQDIERMETDIPNKAMVHAIVDIG